MRFVRHFAIALFISGIIILINESAELWIPDFMPWLYHLFIIIFISFVVAIAERVINKKKQEVNKHTELLTKKVEESEDRYRRLFEDDLAGDFITDSNGFITDCNGSFLEIFGYSEKSELIGKHISIFHVSHAEFRSLISSLKQKQVLKNYETLKRKKNGESIYLIENIAALFDEKGEISSITGYIFDITVRKKAEQAIREAEKTARTLLNASGSTYVLVNASDFRILDINRAGTLLLGTKYDSLKGADALRLFKSISTLIPEKMKEAVRGAKTIRFQEESGGKHFYNQLYPLKDDAGEIARLAVFIEDITEIQQIRELTDFNKELSELNRTKDRLISVIGHDLKSPLSGILNLSGLLSRNFRNYNAEKTETYLKSIYNTSEQILILLDNLLVWAKSRRGQMDFLPGHIMLNSIIPEISEVFRLSAENKNIKIVNNVRKEIFCFADQNMLKSILRNLVQNSIKFTNPGGWVSIDASRKGKCTEIAVEDNGVGFPEGVILIPGAGSNFSTDGTVSEKGTGLGLLLCREFIEKHNGHITIESEKNRGSRIVISLPDKEE